MLFSSKGGPTWIVAFLGNPGLKYAGTRHNAGIMTADALCKKHDFTVNKARFQALTAQVELGGARVLLMKPQTYMNLSGQAVSQAARFYKIPPEHILVVSDEVSLPIGKLRIRVKGSAGGHNGLKNIIEQLGTENFPRIRLGVGAPPNPDFEMVDWVLSVFRNEDAAEMEKAAARAAEAVECYIEKGPDKAMNLYNTK